MTMTQTSQSISSTLIAARAKKVPLYKAFVLPANLADIEALRLNIPYRSKGAIEVRDIAKRLGAVFNGAEWEIARSKIEGTTGQECLDTLNALRTVASVKWIERQRVARSMGIKTIYLKVPYDQRLLAAADGARWSPDPAIRKWAFTVIPNDSTFSALISKWEELGLVDADLTEERAFAFTSDAIAAKASRPSTATVQQFSITASPSVVIETGKDIEEASRLEGFFNQMCNCNYIKSDEAIILKTELSYRSVITPTTVYTISCYYLNPAYKSIVPVDCVVNPTVLVWTAVWEDCPQGSDQREKLSFHKSYYMDAALMRKFWNAATGAGFRVHDLKTSYTKAEMTVTKDRQSDKVKTVAWGLLHDPVFTLGAFHSMAKS